MRYGVISDVHANLHALDAALAFLATQDVDGYLCAGDLVGYGPFPNECVRGVAALHAPGVAANHDPIAPRVAGNDHLIAPRVAGNDHLIAPCVAGNHDLIALGRLSDERCIPLARASLRWTHDVLDAEARAVLSALPLGLATEDGVAVHHGSLRDPQEYVVTEAQALACLDDLPGVAPGAQVLILGHTHRPAAVGRRSGSLLRGGTGAVSLSADEPVLLNPGAVGQSRSRDPRARVMVLDLAERVAHFHALDYDVAGCREALRERGLPADSCHRPRSRWNGVTGAVKRRIRRFLPATLML